MADDPVSCPMKLCMWCSEVKPRTAFYRRNPNKDWVSAKCRDCFRKVTAAARHADPGKIKRQKADYHNRNRTRLNMERRQRAADLGKRRVEMNPLRLAHVTERRCPGCEQVLPADGFYTNPRNRDGLASRCKACAKGTTRNWAKHNKDRVSAQRQLRRARKASAEGHHTAADLVRIRRAQKNKCAACDVGLGETCEVDHIKPLSKGGSNWPSNISVSSATEASMIAIRSSS